MTDNRFTTRRPQPSRDAPGSGRALRRRQAGVPQREPSRGELPLCSVPRYMSTDFQIDDPRLDYSSWNYLQDPGQVAPVRWVEATPTRDANAIAEGEEANATGPEPQQPASPDATTSATGEAATGGPGSGDTGAGGLHQMTLTADDGRRARRGRGDGEEGAGGQQPDTVQQQDGPGSRQQEAKLPAPVIARTGYIVAPRVPAPPPAAIKRAGDIRQRTGSPPELHHAKIQQAVLRVVDAARGGQRQIVWRTNNLARDTRQSFNDIALEILAFTAGCIKRVRQAVAGAKQEMTRALDAQLEHLQTWGSRSEEELSQGREQAQQEVHEELFRNQTELSQQHLELQQEFTPYLLDAQTNILNINQWGEAYHITPPPYGANPPPVPEGQPNQSSVPPGPRKSLSTAHSDLTSALKTMAGSNPLGFYHADRITPVLESQYTRTNRDIEQTLQTQARSLDSFRGQFTNYALRLTTPMAEGFAEQQRQAREQLTYQVEDDRHNLAETLGQHGQGLIDKYDGVILHLDKELQPKLEEGLQKAGSQGAKSFREQGEMTQRMMDNTAASLALAYPELVARVAELLPPGQFLNAEELGPQLRAAWDSARKLPDQQYAAMAEQAAQTVQQARAAKNKQLDSLGDSTEKSLQNVGDVVTATRFDFDLYTYQATGIMSEGGWARIRNAREYAGRMATQILESRGDADGALANLLRSFCGSLNNAIDGAGRGYFSAVADFEENMTSGRGSVFYQIKERLNKDLNQRSQTLDAELTKPDTATTTGLVVLNVLTLGATTAVTVGYLVYSDADDDEVFAAFGDLQWPGQPALKYYFEKIANKGDLFKRFDECLSDAQASRARGMFADDAGTRANARESALRDTLSVFGMNAFARESLVKGWHQSEREAAGDARIDALVRDMNDSWTTLFTRSTTDRMNEGYVRGDLGMVLSARMEANLNQARQRSSDHIYQSVQNIEQLAREELMRVQGSTFISDEQVQQLTDDAMVDFASRHRRPTDSGDPNDVAAAREIFIREATAPIYVQRPTVDSRGRYRGGSHHGPPQRVAVDQGVRDYVEAVVRGGWNSEEAETAQQVYEFQRAGRHGRPSRSAQVRITRAFQNQRLNRLERELREHPERRDQIMPRLREERAKQEARMLRLARRLEPAPSDADIAEAGGATQYMAQRTARLFGGEDYVPGRDSGAARSEAQENAQYGYELITRGRASLTAGVRLATRDTGTNEDLLRMTFQDRSKAEVAQARADWQSRYGESMDAMLGIGRHRGMSGGEFALGLVTNPAATLMFGRVTEVSGDLANDIEILARGNPETDQDYIELAALRSQHQRQQGTGLLARITMSGTDEAQSIDAETRAMASQLLTEAQRQRGLKIEGGADPDSLPLPRSPDAVFTADGRIDPRIARLVFQRQHRGDRKTEPRFTGNRDALLTRSMRVEQAATRYRMEVDRQEQLMLAGITALAIAATVILMAFGVGFVLASVIVALGAGLLTIAVKSGMRGQRYGWEEAATDMANTAIEVAAAGAGGALAGGLGKSGMVVGRLARVGEGINRAFGRVGGAMVREAITGAASSAAQTAIQDGTYDEGADRALGRILLGGLKGASISAVSAGVSESVGNRLNRALAGQLDDAANTGQLARLGSRLGPTGSQILKEGVSEGLGGMAGEAMGIYIDLASGRYQGSLQDALQRMGQAGLKDMIRSGGRAGVSGRVGRSGRNRARYNELLAAARRGDELSTQDLQALRATSMAAGDPPRSLDEIRQQIALDRRNLSLLPPDLQALARSMDSDSLGRLAEMLHRGELGAAGPGRLDLFASMSEKNPALDFAALRDQMELHSQRMAGEEAAGAREAFEATARPLREQLTADLPGPVRDALGDIPVRGLEHLPASELPRVAGILARGQLNPREAEALVRAAQRQNPDLDTVGFLKNLNSAVQSARLARDAHTRVLARQRAETLEDVPPQAIGVFARLPDAAIDTLRSAMAAGDLPAPHRVEALLRQAQAIDPSLDRGQFRQHLQQAVANARQRQHRQQAAARAQRQQHMTQVPEHLRGVLSVLPDAGLVELHLRQMEGSLSPAERLRLEQAALREDPNLDLTRFHQALDEAITQGTPLRATPEQEQVLRQNLLASVPADQRHKVARVPVLLMPDAAFAHYARSASGNAVTVILHGKPVVVLRQGADPGVLREEGIHALQAQDPRWRQHIGSLDEARLSRWDDLPLEMQLALYRNKLELEIDAHDRMVDDLANQLLRSDDPAQQRRLRLELELAQRTLGNLENRMAEAAGITPLRQLQIRAGLQPKPQWLLQPARLFNKASDDLLAAASGDIKTGGRTARALKTLIDQLDADSVQTLLGLGLSAAQLRTVLRTHDATDATSGLIRDLAALASQLPAGERQRLLGELVRRQELSDLAPLLRATAELAGDPSTALRLVEAVATLRGHHLASARQMESYLRQANPDQRQRLAELVSRIGADGRVQLMHLMGEISRTVAGLSDDPDASRAVLDGIIQAAAGYSGTQRVDLIQKVHELMAAVHRLPPGATRDQLLTHVLEGFSSRGDLQQHALDVRAAARRLQRGELTTDLAKSFAESVARGDRLTGGDAFLLHLAEKTGDLNTLLQSPAYRAFAELMDTALPHLNPAQRAALMDMQPWFQRVVASDAFQQRVRQSGGDVAAAQRALLQELFINGLRLELDLSRLPESQQAELQTLSAQRAYILQRAMDLLNQGRDPAQAPELRGRTDVANFTTLRRIMGEVREEVVTTTAEPDFNQLVRDEMRRMGLDPEQLRQRQEDEAFDRRLQQARLRGEELPETHLENLLLQQVRYQRMIDMAADIARQRHPNDPAARTRLVNELTAGLQQRITEVTGEIAATQTMLTHPRYQGMSLLLGFAAGTGVDQIWVRRDASGNITEILVVEAKGPGASIARRQKGMQMGARWLATTANQMVTGSNPIVGMVLHEAMRTGRPPISGMIVQARDEHGNPHQPQGAPDTSGPDFRYNMDELRQQAGSTDPEPRQLQQTLQQRLAEEGLQETHDLPRYSDETLQRVIDMGRQVGLSPRQIEDLLMEGCRKNGPVTAGRILRTLELHLALVRARGYPFQLDSAMDLFSLLGKGVEPDMLAKDQNDGILRRGVYPKNPLTFELRDRLRANGQIQEQDSDKGVHGRRMFVIDTEGNVWIGKRDPNGEIRMPHPTLVGGRPPQIIAAGMIEFSKGRILEVDNASGHFKPRAQSLQAAEELLRALLPPGSFHRKFKGFNPVEGSQ